MSKGSGIRNYPKDDDKSFELKRSNVIRYKREYPEVSNERLGEVIGLTTSQVADILNVHHQKAKNFDPSKRRNR